jgi:hypothetical protein
MLDKLYLLAANVKIPTTDSGGNPLIPKVDLKGGTIGQILSVVFVFIGGLATLMLIIASISYIISNGEASKISQAKQAILYALVGLVVSISGFAIVQFVAGIVSM